MILRSAAPLGYTAASYGLAAMAFVWESAGKSQVWRFYPEIPQSEPIQFEEKAGVGGSQLLSVTLDGFEPATGLLKGEMDGELLAPAIHIETSVHHMITGHSPQDDIWLFLMRSPWFPLKLGIREVQPLPHDRLRKRHRVDIHRRGRVRHRRYDFRLRGPCTRRPPCP